MAIISERSWDILSLLGGLQSLRPKYPAKDDWAWEADFVEVDGPAPADGCLLVRCLIIELVEPPVYISSLLQILHLTTSFHNNLNKLLADTRRKI